MVPEDVSAGGDHHQEDDTGAEEDEGTGQEGDEVQDSDSQHS